jgi:transposase
MASGSSRSTQPDKSVRRRRGKTDAESAARAALSGRATTIAKTSDGLMEMMRMFKTAKDSAVKSRTQACRSSAARVTGWTEQPSACPPMRRPQSHQSHDLHSSAAAYTLRSLARRILQLAEEINDLNGQITSAISTCCPALLDCYGVGPDTAATLLITAGDNPKRLHDEASFAV